MLRMTTFLIPTLVLFGYQASAIISHLLSTTTSITGITYRVAVILLFLISVFYFQRAKLDQEKKLSLLFALVFFILYSLRVLFSEDLARPKHILLIWTWGAAFTSFFLGWFIGRLTAAQMLLLTFSITVACGYIMLFGDTYILGADGLIDVRRLALPRLNPSYVSSLGGLAVIMSLAINISFPRLLAPKTCYLISLICGFLGVCLLIYGGSRAAVLATAAALFFSYYQLAIASSIKLPTIHFISVLVAVIGVKLVTEIGVELVTETNFLNVFQGSVITNSTLNDNTIVQRVLNSNLDQSVLGRLEALKDAFQLFREHPLFGSTLEVPFWNYSPHNIIVEAIIGLGLIGSIPFFALLLVAFKNSIFIRIHGTNHIIIGALFISSFILSLLSGSVWNSTAFWFCLGLAINKTNANSKS